MRIRHLIEKQMKKKTNVKKIKKDNMKVNLFACSFKGIEIHGLVTFSLSCLFSLAFILFTFCNEQRLNKFIKLNSFVCLNKVIKE